MGEKMKIGILTHHYINNFGAFLQAYSLQKVIQELFSDEEVYIINYINLKHFIINIGGWFRFYKRRENLACWFQKIRLPATFARARKRNMHLTKVCFDAKGIEKLGVDCIVVGSDEVWNYRETKSNAVVKFGIGLDRERLIAYAPSVGQANDGNVPGYVREGIRSFKSVSARDDLTQKMVEEIRKESIARVVDPTFLIRIPIEPVKDVKKPYMLFYYCDGFPSIEKKEIIEYAHAKGMNVYGAGECDKAYSSITVNLTPFQWAWMFQNAEWVVTGTFHGTVFSMLNHRQFACYLTNSSRIQKVSSLLDEFGLNARRGAGNAKEIICILEKKIDYQTIEKIFEERRRESKSFLKNSLT